MSDATITTLAVALLVVLTSGGAVALGTAGPAASLAPTASGPADGTPGVAAVQEGNATQNDTTTQTGSAQGASSTNVTLRNVTLERLTLRNVTVTDAQFGNLTVVDATGGDGGNETRQTYQNVTVQRIAATGFVTDVTLENVSIRSAELATQLVNESGRVRVPTRLIMDVAYLSNRTVEGLAVDNATVYAGTAENLSVGTTGGNATGGDAGGTDGSPAIVADSAVVANFSLTTFEVSGVSQGETTQTEAGAQTTAAAEATATAEGTTVPAEGTTAAEETTVTAETTTAATQEVVVNTTTTTTLPAEARSGATDDETTTES